MDGYVIIGTELDTKQLEQELRKTKKELEKYQNEASELTKVKVKYEEEGKGLKSEATQLKKNKKILEDYNRQLQELHNLQDMERPTMDSPTTDKYLQLKEEEALLTHKMGQLQQQTNELQIQDDKYREQINKIAEINKKIKENKDAQDGLIDKTKQLNQELGKKNDVENLKNRIKEMRKDMKGLLRSVVKWGLAIYGIRSMYNFIRSAMSIISESDPQLKADIDYIKNALIYTLEPVVKKIVEWAKKILFYVGYIINEWFGYNIFQNANKNLENANKNAKKLLKTMAKFDEMTTLTEQDKDNTVLPSFDLTKYTGVEVPQWLKELASKKDDIVKIAETLAWIFGTAFVLKGLSTLEKLFLGTHGLYALLKTLTSIVAIAGGIIITGYVAYQTWEDIRNLKKEMQEIADRSREAQDEWIQKEDELNNLIETGNVNRTAGLELLKDSEIWWHKIVGLSSNEVGLAKQTAEYLDRQIDKEIDLWKQGKLNNEQKKKLVDNLIEQKYYNDILIEKLMDQGGKYDDILKKNDKYVTLVGLISDEINGVNTDIQAINNARLEDKKFKVDVDTTPASKGLQKIFGKIENTLYTLFGRFGFDTSPILSKIKNVLGLSTGGIVIPKLASGGIINRPSKGVPIGSAIGGESGMEGVIPLTNSQQMALLGEAIGKYITINANITNTMNGKVISREIQKINNESDFAFNR